MKLTQAIVVGLIVTMAPTLARAQEEDEDRRRDYMHRLHEDCEHGDEEACARLDEMREEWRERHRRREYEEWRRSQERPRDYDEDQNRRRFVPQADPKVALCLAIETNYNNCMRQHGGRQNECAAWVYELKTNKCF
ncbi:hypothetical protein [Methylosinus sporium]|uniref:hypothetical protein n=1 Tax=Methylosinus sporium TaxID=428 RepID=UPI00383A9C9A